MLLNGEKHGSRNPLLPPEASPQTSDDRCFSSKRRMAAIKGAAETAGLVCVILHGGAAFTPARSELSDLFKDRTLGSIYHQPALVCLC